jgi:hypothetical protein
MSNAPELFSVTLRDAIANALHAALTGVMQPSITHIAPINTIGCFLLRHITGVDYVPVAGSITVNAGVQRFGIAARPERIAEHEYYVWTEARYESGHVEIVDFGARYWKAWAKESGVLWVGDPPPNVVWNWRTDIPATVAYYEEQPNITNDVRNAIEQAVAAPEPEPAVAVWEQTVNVAIDRLMDSDVGREYLEARGVIEPQ